MIALLPLFRDLPQAVLGAIVIAAVLGFLRLDELRRIARFRRLGLAIALVALFATLVLGILPGLIIAVLLALLSVLVSISRPPMPVLGRDPATGAFMDSARNPAAAPIPGLLAIRLDAPMLFLNAALVRDTVRQMVEAVQPHPEVALLDLGMSPQLDIESIDVLQALGHRLREDGVELWLAGARGRVRDMLDRSNFDANIRVFVTLTEAASAFDARQETQQS
jgi:MFS superfamily sulfate permease-like transporter